MNNSIWILRKFAPLFFISISRNPRCYQHKSLVPYCGESFSSPLKKLFLTLSGSQHNFRGCRGITSACTCAQFSSFFGDSHFLWKENGKQHWHKVSEFIKKQTFQGRKEGCAPGLVLFYLFGYSDWENMGHKDFLDTPREKAKKGRKICNEKKSIFLI